MILGAGLAGLSAAHALTSEGVKVGVIEKEDSVGGLARTLEHEGFKVDLGPHRFHGKNDRITEKTGEIIGGDWSVLERRSRIYLEGGYFDYPLKPANAVLTMPAKTSLRIVLDYIKASAVKTVNPKPDVSFEDWVVNRFGRKLYDIYFGPYTEKVWGLHPTKISKDWAAQRITLMSLWDTLVKSVFSFGEKPRTYVSQFHYPNEGGIGIIPETLKSISEAGGCRFHLGATPDSVKTGENRIQSVSFTDAGGKKRSLKVDRVISTIPLSDLVSILTPRPDDRVVGASEKMMSRAIVFVYIIVRGRLSLDDHWIYFPAKNIVFNRIFLSRNFNARNVRDGMDVIGAEVTCTRGDELWDMPHDEVAAKVVGDLASLGLIREEDVSGSFVHRESHAYPIYDLDYKRNLDTVEEFVGGLENLVLAGRNGLFRYNNMDHSVAMGLLAGEGLVRGDSSLQKKIVNVVDKEEYFG